jgi:rfaE bifunctional protein nucleotidyltransferase chain/domain/rfaE bifunctional protein kinase chain/domain
MKPLVVVGDALLDRDIDGAAHRLAPDAPVPVVADPTERARPGGGALAATLAARQGHPVTLITALGDDPAGRRLAALLAAEHVTVIDVGLRGPTAEKVRVRAAGQPVARLDYGGRDGEIAEPSAEALAALDRAPVVLVSDYGRGMATSPRVRQALTRATARGAQLVWDPHPRGADPVTGTRVVTPNLAEACRAAGAPASTDLAAVTSMAGRLRDRWASAGVVVTLGARGALLVSGDGTPLMVPAPAVGAGDPCGAGDRFSGAVAGALADGAVLSEAVVAAVAAASAFVAAGGAGALPAPPAAVDGMGATDAIGSASAHGTGSAVTDGPRAAADGPRSAADAAATAASTSALGDDALAVVGRDVARVVAGVRARGGTVVATGGCFDLLHAGHVRLLADARRLGDCLVVCMNSDDSVRRLKGAGRPVVSTGDRRAVLLGLTAVDAVAVFDEDTPEHVLSHLRPDVWVKGADYAVADLPEAPLLASWGGQAVVLPYLAGRSTTSMIKEAARHV